MNGRRGDLVIGVGVVLASGIWLLSYLLVGDDRHGALAAVIAAPAVLVAAGAAGRWGGRRVVWFPAVVPVVGAVLAGVATGGVDTGIGAAAGLGVLLWCPWLSGRWLRARAELGRAGWQSAARWEARARVVEDDARRRERARLAAEMHDLVGHDLARATLGLGGLELDGALPPEVRRAVAAVREQLTAAGEHLAEAVTALAADRSTAQGAGGVAAVVDGVRAAGREVVLVPTDPTPLLGDLDEVVSELVVRVVREGLTNGLKHGGDGAIGVSIARWADAVDVVIRSRGASPRPVSTSGRGLAGLGSDLDAVSGSLRHGRSGEDHLLAARLPLRVRIPGGGPAGVDDARRSAIGDVRRSRGTAVRGIAAVVAMSALMVAAYRVVDVATSVLPPRTFDAVAPGSARAAVQDRLPMRTRTDGSEIPRPPGSWCEHYGVSADPLSADLFRLCWSGGTLVRKDLIARSISDPGTIGT